MGAAEHPPSTSSHRTRTELARLLFGADTADGGTVTVGGAKIAVYPVSGFCSALSGLLFTLYVQSGDPLHAVGLELDAIAAVVIGGTLLTGGSGYVIGTLFGVLVLGLIKTIIQFEGTLSSWWTKIATGVLLFAFILIQRTMTARRNT
jgi:simple sugar transport system permease protein